MGTPAVIGEFAHGGGIRVCPAPDFFDAMWHLLRGRGLAVPLCPVQGSAVWGSLMRVRRADGRWLWGLAEDDTLVDLVPASVADPRQLVPALQHVHTEVVRGAWHLKNEEGSPPFFHEGVPYAWPRISAVEFGNGWLPERLEQRWEVAPEEGEILIRVRGGVKRCPVGGDAIVHSCEQLWVVLHKRGYQIVCANTACVRRAVGHKGRLSVRGPSTPLPDAIQHQLTQWLEQTNADKTLPSCRERPIAPGPVVEDLEEEPIELSPQPLPPHEDTGGGFRPKRRYLRPRYQGGGLWATRR